MCTACSSRPTAYRKHTAALEKDSVHRKVFEYVNIMAILEIYTGYVLGGVMISRTLFGTTPDGLPAYTYTLAAGSQVVVLTDFGAAIT